MKRYILFFVVLLSVLFFSVIAIRQFEFVRHRSDSQASFAEATKAGAILITETTVGTMSDGTQVPFANVVTDPDLTGMLLPENESPITIRKGDVVHINGQAYRVLDLWLDENNHGHVALLKF